MDYEHDDRRAADVPGASGAEGSGLPAGREAHEDSLSPRSPEVRAFDPEAGSELIATSSDRSDDLFDGMFLPGGMRPPAFSAVDHELGFRAPQTPDLASAFLAALDAIDDRRFVTPVPEEPPAPQMAPAAPVIAEPFVAADASVVAASVVAASVVADAAVVDAVGDVAVGDAAVADIAAAIEAAPVSDAQLAPAPQAPSAPEVWNAPAEPVSGEAAYELRPQSQLELETSTALVSTPSAPIDDAPSASTTTEGAEPLPWDAPASDPAPIEAAPEESVSAPAVSEPVGEETWAFASYLESEEDLRLRAAALAAETAAAVDERIDERIDGRIDDRLHEHVEASGSAVAAEEAIAPVAPVALIAEAAELAEVEEAAAAPEAAAEEVEESANGTNREPIAEGAYFGAPAGSSDITGGADTSAYASADAISSESGESSEDDALAVTLAASDFGSALDRELENYGFGFSGVANANANAEREAAEAAAVAAALEAAALDAAIFRANAIDSRARVTDAVDVSARDANAHNADARHVDSFDNLDNLDDLDDAALEAALDEAAREAALEAAAIEAAALENEEFDALDDLTPAHGLTLGEMPGDDDFGMEPTIGAEPMDAAPMAFDGPDAFAVAAVAAAEPEPAPESDELEDLQDYVVFSLGDLRCVVPIRNVIEVGRIPDAAAVPNAPVWLHGLGNLRGQVLSLIDLRAFFGVGRIKPSTGRMVVLRGDEDDIIAGVMVDQVHQIVALSPSRFKDAPPELPLPERSSGFVWGACDYGNVTMLGLDVDGVLGVESLTEETVV
jgi:chemotaxis signal transduction protein